LWAVVIAGAAVSFALIAGCTSDGPTQKAVTIPSALTASQAKQVVAPSDTSGPCSTLRVTVTVHGQTTVVSQNAQVRVRRGWVLELAARGPCAEGLSGQSEQPAALADLTPTRFKAMRTGQATLQVSRSACAGLPAQAEPCVGPDQAVGLVAVTITD
jgi:hypothetical protein